MDGVGDGSAEFMETLPPTNDGQRLPQIHYINSDHLGSAFAAMNLMRQSNQLCDISLEVLDNSTPPPGPPPASPASPVSPSVPVRLVRAHKVVLAAASAYFNAMFNSELNPLFEGFTRFLPNLSSDKRSLISLNSDFSFTGNAFSN